MLLAHQIGSVKIGEVIRYTVTYTPSHDRILPSPEFLYLRIRNTSAIALRAAFVHGPYTLSVAAYPSHFNPSEKFEHPRRYGVPEFEPMLKAGGVWNCHLVVPDTIRESAGTGGSRHAYFGAGPPGGENRQSVSWVVEVASQVIFSSSASVNYEIVLARDEKSLSLGSSVPVIGGHAQMPQPGRVGDIQQVQIAAAAPGGIRKHHHMHHQPKGVFSRAIHLKVEDTAALWNTPELPGWDEAGRVWLEKQGAEVVGQPEPALRRSKEEAKEAEEGRAPKKKQKKVHLVVLTHGIHSNLGADMLFLKESIDAGVKQAKIDAKARRERERAERAEKRHGRQSQQADGNHEQDDNTGDDVEPVEEDEEVIVRGFAGNATRTEKGIKYLGKRMARYVLSMTYPDQPFLPATEAVQHAVAHARKGSKALTKEEIEGKPAHKHSSVHQTPSADLADRAYKITKISFISHSLGGLVQTYAIAYIQKHSPQFFDLIEPINFIAMASPFLGLNHENPLYVKFALDFGLVGRTGQDLGLTWRAPTIARSGWGAIVSNLGENAHKRVYGEAQAESKPLLRILPTGPAHTALRKFRNRTVYSNVVNDGIVPLRTSCLLFLDWQGLGRVEKARREAGLVETLVGFGWAELTGANVTSPKNTPWTPIEEDGRGRQKRRDSSPAGEEAHEVPQPSTNATLEDDRQSLRSVVTTPYHEAQPGSSSELDYSSQTHNNPSNPFSGFFNLFRSHSPPKSPPPATAKQRKIYQRSQTLRLDDANNSDSPTSSNSKVTNGHELSDTADGGLLSAPPKTTFFESAGDLLNPKLPSVEYLIDPSKRPRTIFHDRIYHPSDIPPPPLKKLRQTGSLALRRRSYTRTSSTSSIAKTPASEDSSPFPSPGPGGPNHQDSGLSTRDYDDTAHTNPDKDPNEVIDSSGMKVEEKIARAYHRGLSWRKVLVKLEPDAHNNIVVRRMFANAFGWPVVKHLVDAHFSDSEAARTRDEEESNTERAKNPAEPPDEHGAETTTERQEGEGVSTGLGITELKDANAADVEEEGGDKQQRRRSPSPKSRPSQPPPERQNSDDLKPPSMTATLDRTDSEAREAADKVPDLPVSPRFGSLAAEDKALGSLSSVASSPNSLSPRPPYDRLDSVTWSDRDWADSADEETDEEQDSISRAPSSQGGSSTGGGSTKESAAAVDAEKGKGIERTSSPLLKPSNWSWTEKIVGKSGGTSEGGSSKQRKKSASKPERSQE